MSTQDHKLNTESLFIPGSEIGDKFESCVIPLFKHNVPSKQDTYIIGNVFFKEYYVVFDMTPFDENN